MAESESFGDLVSIMDRQRGPEGCPWDREQTYATLRRYVLEECYEVADAIDRLDPDELREELGDLLFQIVFLSRLAHEDGHFTAHDVVRGIAAKMVRRHPHVFGGERVTTADEVLQKWEALKRRERDGETAATGGDDSNSVLDGIPRALPAVMKAQQMGARAARVGFEWERETDILDKVGEELDELREVVATGDRPRIGEELGDVLFTIVMLARRLDVDAEAALERSNLKFQGRFRRVERAVRSRGLVMEQAGLELLDRLWDETKASE
jgi:MazG family protein